MNYIVEKNIPVTGSVRGRKADYDVMFAGMEVNDSVLVDRESVCAQAHGFSRRNADKNIKFTQRKVGNGWRIWRIA